MRVILAWMCKTYCSKFFLPGSHHPQMQLARIVELRLLWAVVCSVGLRLCDVLRRFASRSLTAAAYDVVSRLGHVGCTPGQPRHQCPAAFRQVVVRGRVYVCLGRRANHAPHYAGRRRRTRKSAYARALLLSVGSGAPILPGGAAARRGRLCLFGRYPHCSLA